MWIFNNIKHKDRMSSQRGVTFLGAVILIFTLSTLGTGLATYVATNQVVRGHQYTSEESFYLTQAGIEFAQRKIMMENKVISQIIGTYEIGNGSFSLADGGGGTVVITGMREYAVAPYSMKIQPGEALCTNADVSGAYFTSADRKVNEIFLENICPRDLTLDQLRVDWSPITPATKMFKVVIDGNVAYTNPAVGPGVQIDIDDITLPASATVRFDYAQFKNFNVEGKDVTITFIFSDTSEFTSDPFQP